MEAFMAKMFEKNLIAMETWGAIKDENRLFKYSFESGPPEGFCFHAKLKEHLDSDEPGEKITAVSISYPPDLYSDDVVEIALLDQNDSVTGVNRLGIEDVAQIPKDKLIECMILLANNKSISQFI